MNDTVGYFSELYRKQIVMDMLSRIDGVLSVQACEEPKRIAKEGGIIGSIPYGPDIPEKAFNEWLIPILKEHGVHGRFILSTGSVLGINLGYLNVELDSEYKWAVKLLHVCDDSSYQLIRIPSL